MHKTIIIAVVAVIVVLILLTQSLYTIDETKQVIVLQLGKYQQTVTQPGLHAKIPFIQSVKTLDNRVMMSDAPSTSYLTLDKKNLVVDHVTRWFIEDPRVFYTSVGQTESRALQRLQAIVVSELRDELASHNFVDIISTQREPIMDAVAKRTADKAVEFGIAVLDVRIKRADLPKEVQESVFARMKAERERKAKEYRAEGEEEALKTRAEADREAIVILAEAYKTEQTLKGTGDALATAIYAAAYDQSPDFYSLLRTLEAYSKFMNDETILVLSTESDLFSYLSEFEGQE
ncbi:MAG: protease modulator HflC [Chloroflexota bacterium]|nr:protease modulator HflC [Chloroflexota bacterium]